MPNHAVERTGNKQALVPRRSPRALGGGRSEFTMGIARLKALTGELIDVRFRTYFSGTPGGGGVASTKAADVRVSLTVPPDRPHPDLVLVKLHAEDLYGRDREFHVTLEPTGERSYSGQLDDHLVIMTTGPGRPPQSKEQGIEAMLIRGADCENLVDPINGSLRFQVNLDWAQFSD
jgi:hypothetical protein